VGFVVKAVRGIALNCRSDALKFSVTCILCPTRATYKTSRPWNVNVEKQYNFMLDFNFLVDWWAYVHVLAHRQIRIHSQHTKKKESGKMSTTMFVALMVLLALQLDAQLTVDDNSGSCESSTSDEVLNLIKESWRDVKTACASNQQKSVAVDTSGLCKWLSLFRFFSFTTYCNTSL